MLLCPLWPMSPSPLFTCSSARGSIKCGSGDSGIYGKQLHQLGDLPCCHVFISTVPPAQAFSLSLLMTMIHCEVHYGVISHSPHSVCLCLSLNFWLSFLIFVVFSLSSVSCLIFFLFFFWILGRMSSCCPAQSLEVQWRQMYCDWLISLRALSGLMSPAFPL